LTASYANMTRATTVWYWFRLNCVIIVNRFRTIGRRASCSRDRIVQLGQTGTCYIRKKTLQMKSKLHKELYCTYIRDKVRLSKWRWCRTAGWENPGGIVCYAFLWRPFSVFLWAEELSWWEFQGSDVERRHVRKRRHPSVEHNWILDSRALPNWPWLQSRRTVGTRASVGIRLMSKLGPGDNSSPSCWRDNWLRLEDWQRVCPWAGIRRTEYTRILVGDIRRYSGNEELDIVRT
jgi:hypothetical protein